MGMLSKLKLLGLIGAGLALLITLGSMIISNWRLDKAVTDYHDAKVEVVVTGTSANAEADLGRRVEANEKITQDSLETLEKMKDEVSQPPPEPVLPPPVVKQAKVVHVGKPQPKDPTHEKVHRPQPASSNVALRALNELWVDFCKRFPTERDCRERETQAKELQANPATRS